MIPGVTERSADEDMLVENVGRDVGAGANSAGKAGGPGPPNLGQWGDAI
jgi:hypothetical protein